MENMRLSNLVEIKKEENIEKNLYNKKLGRKGEDLATLFLKENGYRIIERNFKSKNGEVDIIAKKKEEIIFIEVKTRTSKIYGRPIEAVSKSKMKHIINTSKYYMIKNNLENLFVRYDIIEIYIIKNKIYISHIKNVFY